MLECFNQKLPEIKYSKTGKPYFKNSVIYFNYSHSKNYIACAISNKEVGIDIEETNTNISDKVSNKYLDNEKETEKRRFDYGNYNGSLSCFSNGNLHGSSIFHFYII